MLRTILSIALIASLAGCLDATPAEDDPPKAASLQQPYQQPAPGSASAEHQTDDKAQEPVSIHEDIDLSQGSYEFTWNWHVAPGATTVKVSAALVPLEDAPFRHMQDTCFVYKANGDGQHRSGRSCAGNNAVVKSNLRSDEEQLLHHTEAFPADWVVSFSAEPALARFLLDVEVSYD